MTVPALAYYLRGDECPRCMTEMTRRSADERFARTPAAPPLPEPDVSARRAASA